MRGHTVENVWTTDIFAIIYETEQGLSALDWSRKMWSGSTWAPPRLVRLMAGSATPASELGPSTASREPGAMDSAISLVWRAAMGESDVDIGKPG